jgi:deoxyribose-phosphate aldolase
MKNIGEYIDQTILKPDATKEDILHFLSGFCKYGFFAAVVNPCWVPLVKAQLSHEVKLCSVVGFPLGASSTKTKVCAAEDLVQQGCHEIDMVMNIGKLREKDYKYVAKEIKSVSEVCQGKVLKVIIETCLLAKQEKVAATHIIKESGAQFVKTSTGFGREGAKIEDVRLLRTTVGPDFGVKASGGIKTYVQALQFIEAGANRLGTSSGVQIMEQAQKSKNC